LLVNAEIRANDRVHTGPGAMAVLTLNDVGSVLIGPGTECYLGDPGKGQTAPPENMEGKSPRYAACFNCHRKGKKTSDLD
jgi:hypothetical protein